jgi:hypothetical protein
MARRRALAAFLGCAALSGCFGPRPFVAPVQAQPLQAVAAEVHVAEVVRTVPRPGPSASPAEAAAQRTDVRGLGDGSADVDIDVVRVEGSRIRHDVPDYSPEQTASMICQTEKMGFGGAGARRAHRATVEVRELRQRVDAGTATLDELDRAEQRRQQAVRSALVPIPLLNLLVNGQRADRLPLPRQGSLVLENVDPFTFRENGKPVTAVAGVVRNEGSARSEAPPLTLEAVDQWGMVLAGQTSLLPFEAVEGGESRPFEVRFLNPPANTVEVRAHFAPPFAFRARRDCDFFDPSTFDDADTFDAAAPRAEPPMAPQPAVGEAVPAYTAAELNLLTQYYRREAAAAWECRADASRRRCTDAGRRLNWRDMFVLSEAIDEAWIAVRAAEESRRRLAAGAGARAEAEAAELARQASIRLIGGLGERALARAGGSAPDVAVELTSSTWGLDAQGLFVQISGQVKNTSAALRQVDALMIAVVDRFGLPLSATAAVKPLTLAPGESASFSERAGLSRRPPEDVEWSVRVGAMGR